MIFRMVCPRCGRRYPKKFTTCLECGETLVDTDRVARKKELKKYLPALGIVLLSLAILLLLVVVVLPLIQFSLASGQEFGTISKTTGSSSAEIYRMNQPATDGNLEISITRVRSGAPSANRKQFLLVSTSVRNLQTDAPLRVAAGDIILLDAAKNSYPAYSIGDKVFQEVLPGRSEAYDIVFEVPMDAADLSLQYTFPQQGGRSGKTVVFLLQ